MDIHEYQAKLILQYYNIPIPPFFVVSSLDELKRLIHVYKWETAVLKAQVHAGGRGKAGGVKLAKNQDEIVTFAQELLGKKIINQQTGPEGLVNRQLLMTEIIPILKEFYLAIVIDRKRAQRIVIASPSGGMDIEKVASEQPEQVLNLKIPDQGQLYSYQHLQLAKFLGWKGSVALEGMHLVNKLTQVFIETDALLLEINPLVETVDQKLMVLDTKLSVDDNALFRQSEIKAFFDPTQMSSSEARAHQHELAYVALNGTIGCMVNGAGLAMATMDIIHYHGGQAANFLDVGGGASKEKVAEGFKIILSDLKVKVILINIFGGIMNCETLAEGIIAAARDIQLHVPLVVRMEGTRVEEGKQRLKESNLVIEIANSLDEAARLAVAKG